MDNQIVTQFQNFPQSITTRLVGFETAEVRPGNVNDTYFLVVNVRTPYLNMKVDLQPLIYEQKPDYWGIDVVGTLPVIGLPAEEIYPVFILLDERVRGKKGVLVIGGVDQSLTLDVPPTKK